MIKFLEARTAMNDDEALKNIHEYHKSIIYAASKLVQDKEKFLKSISGRFIDRADEIKLNTNKDQKVNKQ